MFRTEKRRNPVTGATYPWIVRSHGDGQPLLRLRRRRRLRAVLHQVRHLLPVQRQAVHQRQRVGQAPGRQGRDRLRGAGQRVRRLRGPGTAAADLRPARTRPDRPAAAQVAGPAAAPVHRRGPSGRLPLRHLDPAGRVLPHPGARPAPVGPGVLRGGDPREPRPRPTRPGVADLRPSDHHPRPPSHTGPVPHPGVHRRRHPVAARRLQVDPRQAVPQGRPRPPHRDHHQRQPRLRDRQTAVQPARPAGGRLLRQPTSPRRPTNQPRPDHRRRRLRPRRHTRRSSTANESRPCASATLASTPCSPPSSSSVSCPTGSPTATCAPTSRRCSASNPTSS